MAESDKAKKASVTESAVTSTANNKGATIAKARTGQSRRPRTVTTVEIAATSRARDSPAFSQRVSQSARPARK
jgi:hypothetical protein